MPGMSQGGLKSSICLSSPQKNTSALHFPCPGETGRFYSEILSGSSVQSPQGVTPGWQDLIPQCPEFPEANPPRHPEQSRVILSAPASRPPALHPQGHSEARTLDRMSFIWLLEAVGSGVAGLWRCQGTPAAP